MKKSEIESFLPVVAVVAVFLGLGFLGILRHEMWRDELEIWLIARDSASPLALLANMGTEGHPALWYALTWILARFTHDPFTMQVLSLLIGAATVWVFMTRAPFSLAHRLLFCFGYFPFYEYTVISRNYGVQMLLTFVACAALCHWRGRWIRQALVLFLLANTHMYGSITAVAFGLLLLVEIVPAVREGKPGALGRGSAALAILASGVVLGAGHAIYQVFRMGEAHKPTIAVWDLNWLAESVSSIYYGYVPFPNVLDSNPWNTNILSIMPNAVSLSAGSVLAVLLFAGSVMMLRRNRAVLTAFLLGSGAMLVITFFFWTTDLRHHGQLFLLFVACYWLAGHLPGGKQVEGTLSVAVSSRVFTVVLAIQVLACAHIYGTDLVRPFSNARKVAAYLELPEHRDAVLVGSVDFTAQPISAYLDRPFYHPESGDFHTFADWGANRRYVTAAEVFEDAVSLMREHREDVIVVLCYQVDRPRQGEVLTLARDVRMECIARFEGAIVEDENYFLYRFRNPETRVRGAKP